MESRTPYEGPEPTVEVFITDYDSGEPYQCRWQVPKRIWRAGVELLSAAPGLETIRGSVAVPERHIEMPGIDRAYRSGSSTERLLISLFIGLIGDPYVSRAFGWAPEPLWNLVTELEGDDLAALSEALRPRAKTGTTAPQKRSTNSRTFP